jgi:hypothetical protein
MSSISIATLGMFQPPLQRGSKGIPLQRPPVFPMVKVVEIRDDEKEPQVIVTLIENGE